MSKQKLFTPYQAFVVALLAILQFSVILDFMVLSPLGAQLMPRLHIDPAQFGLVVSAYAFSAGASGLLAAGFADRFDRKKMLLFFMAGFMLGTLMCGLAPTYYFLLFARVLTGIFGGVIGSICFAIITDLFPVEVRGRVMGIVQMSFAVSQVLGLPAGLYLSNMWDWHAPFLMIVVLAIPVWFAALFYMRPVDAHLALQRDRSAGEHLMHTLSKPFYLRAFATTTLLATGGFMLMPFGAAYSVNNLGISIDDLPKVYLVTGICTMIAGPLIGRLTDRVGFMPVFMSGSLLGAALVLVYCYLGVTPLGYIMALNAALFIGITARMISTSTLFSQVPVPADRGAFMGINASVSQISGGFASAIAGMLIHQQPGGYLEHYPRLGWTVCITMLICILLTHFISRGVKARGVVIARG